MKPSAAMILPPWSLGLSEPDGVLHYHLHGIWSLCGRRVKKIMPQRLAATWPLCPGCLMLESIKRAAKPAPPCEASLALERVVQGEMARSISLRLLRLAHAAQQCVAREPIHTLDQMAYRLLSLEEMILPSCATSPRTLATRPWPSKPAATR